MRAMRMDMVIVSHIMFPDSFLRSGFLSGARRHQRLPRQQKQALQQTEPPAVAGPPPPAEAATTVTDAGTAAAGPAAAAASTAESGIVEAAASTQRGAPAKKRRASKSLAEPTKARLAPTALAAKALSTKAESGSALNFAGRYPPKDPIRRARFLVERQMWHDWRKGLNVYASEDNQESYWAFMRAHIALDSENYDEKIDHCITLRQGNSTRESHLRAAF